MRITEEVALEKGWIPDSKIPDLVSRASQNNTSFEEELANEIGSTIDDIYGAVTGKLGYTYIKAQFGIKLDEESANKFKATQMNEDKFIPIFVKGKPYILICDVDNDARTTSILEALGTEPEWCLCTNKLMDTLQNKLVSPLMIDDISLDSIAAGIGEIGDTGNVKDLMRTGQAIPDLLTMIISSAISARASDIHLLPDSTKIAIYFKIDGVKVHFKDLERGVLKQLTQVIMQQADMRDYTVTKPLKGKALYSLGNTTISLRISILKTKHGADINMRVLDNRLFTVQDLGMTDTLEKQYRELFKQSKGIVLFTGPTGSGKSTAMYSGLVESDVTKRTIMSVEDPIEYVAEGITQVEVNEQEGNTFDEVVKGFLRHNPNVIIVGEIRDLPVAKEAFRAAATGHLVFSTLHTNDAVSAISRLMDLGMPAYSIVESLCGVVSQRLVRRVCTNCATEYEVAEGSEEALAGIPVGTKIKKANGCDHCRDLGYYGRLAVNEIVTLTPDVREMLEDGKSITSIRRYIHENQKVPTLAMDAISKVTAGLTTFDEIRGMLHEIL